MVICIKLCTSLNYTSSYVMPAFMQQWSHDNVPHYFSAYFLLFLFLDPIGK